MKTPIDKSKNIIPKVKVSSPVHKIPIVKNLVKSNPSIFNNE
jgi:hypothetical protein